VLTTRHLRSRASTHHRGSAVSAVYTYLAGALSSACTRGGTHRHRHRPQPCLKLNMSFSSGASRPWSAPASPRWAFTSSSTGSEPLCGVDGLVDEFSNSRLASPTHDWPLEGPPAKRLRPITLPDQREPPPLVAPALLALSSAGGISRAAPCLCLQSQRRWRRATRTSSCTMRPTHHPRHRRR